MVERLVGSYLVSERRACRVLRWQERPTGIAVASSHGLSCGCESARYASDLMRDGAYLQGGL